MASPRRRKDSDLSATSPIDDLLARPRRFSFFQAVRLLEREARCRNAKGGKESVYPVGEDHDPRQEAIRFRSTAQLNFPATEILAAERAEDGPDARRRSTVTVGFFGLTGALGAMPESYSDLVQRGVRQKNAGLRDFLDIFNSRLLGLFYRAWAKYRLPVSYERGQAAGREDAITQMLYALIGLGTPALRSRTAVPDSIAVHFAGALAHRPRPAIALEDVFSGALGHIVRIEQFCGEWHVLAEEEQSRLPGRWRSEGRFCRLGVDLVAGARAWEVQGGCRLDIGPLSYAEFAALLPNAARARFLSDLVKFAAGSEFVFDYRLTLRPGETPPFRLGGGGEPMWLGWNTWIPVRGPARSQSVVFKDRPSGAERLQGVA